MFEKIKSIAFWLSVFTEYISSNWFFIALTAGITYFIWHQSRKWENLRNEKWRQAFWIVLALVVLINCYFLYDAYSIKTAPKTTGESILKY